MNIAIIIIVAIVVLSIISYFIFKNGSKVTPPSKQTSKNAECRGDNVEGNYTFGEPKSVNDILEKLKNTVSQYIRIIKNYIRISKEDFVLSPNVVIDPTKIDPNAFYYMGFRKTSNVLKPGNPPNFKWCEEFPNVVYKKLDPPQVITGPTGWTVIKNLNRRAPYKLNSSGDVTCATTPSGACMWQSNDDSALNIINSPTFNPTTIYTCKGNTEEWCKQALPYLKPYPRQTIADAGYVDGTQGPLKRGFYDILGQGVKNDYCRYTGGYPNIKFTCQLSDGSNVFATIYNNKNITDIISGQILG